MLLEDLKRARRSAGLSRRELAERLGVDPQRIKRLESGMGSVATLSAAMAALDFRLTGIGPGATIAEQIRSRRRSPERSYWGQGDKTDRDSRFTPPDFMARIHAAFGEIDLDPCAHSLSPVVARRRILPEEGGDGLVDDWAGRLVYVNPPFSALLAWLRRAHDQWLAGNVETVVCLVPVRTDSALFHDRLSADAEIYLLRGRVRFLDPRGRGQQTPFFLMLVTLGATAEQKDRFTDVADGFWLAPRLEVNPDRRG